MKSEEHQLFADIADTIGCEHDSDAVLFTLLRWRQALEIIAGERPSIDNLLGNKDLARIALHGK